MASYINKYTDAAAYAADASARAALEASTVSMEADSGTLHYDGVNVEKPSGSIPSVGDALWVDASGNKHFYKGTSVDPAALTADGLTFVGVVAMRRGRKVWVLHKDEDFTRFASCWAWEIKGLEYGSSNTVVFQQRGLTEAGGNTYTNYEIGTLTFTPSGIDDAVTKINTWLLANQGGKSYNSLIVANYNWHCAKLDDRIWVIADYDSTPSYRQYEGQVVKASASGGVTSSTNMWTLAGFGTNYTRITRNDGVGSTYALWNKALFKAYNQNVGVPTDSLTTSGVFSESGFNGTTVVKGYYGTYDAYLEAIMAKYPASTGAMGAYAGDGKAANSRMFAIEYVPKGASESVKMFTAVNSAKTREARSGVSVAGLNAGDWYMPGMDEALEIFSRMAPDGSDIVNRAFVQSNSSSRSLSKNRWVPARCYHSGAWYIHRPGCFGYGNDHTSRHGVAAVALLEF